MSNKLSVRRAVVRHPKICVAASCPPPPPPIVWPPLTFDIRLEYTCIPMMGPCAHDETIEVTRMVPMWDWTGAGPPPEGLTGAWNVDELPHTGYLTLVGFNDQWGTYGFIKANIPITWGIPTNYVITAWDMIEWWMTWARATFTF